jgi:DNA-binding response OmpR family regulator
MVVEGQLKILVVDDDPNVTELLPVILANEGFRDVHCFLSSTEAFAALKRPHSTFECLILDIDMPDMNGIELCAQARALSSYRNVPIIMLTARRDEKTVRAAISAGASDYITKPFDVLEIGVRVRMSAKLVQARRALEDRLETNSSSGASSAAGKPSVTRNEIMNLFAEELYESKPPRTSAAGTK